ncbi:MAG: hypothetical protein QOI69_1237 [Pseudonocardiales bacterium]|nr:hypothetical protein [Pseudonocardiales bacterium]
MTAFLTRTNRTDRPSHDTGRPIGGWAFAGVAVTSFGGPLALAELYALSVIAHASASAGRISHHSPSEPH